MTYLKRLKEGFYPPMGGAGRAPGLPQAAAKRICGRGPHPLCAVSARRAQARGGQVGESRCRGCVAPCAGFEVSVEVRALGKEILAV